MNAGNIMELERGIYEMILTPCFCLMDIIRLPGGLLKVLRLPTSNTVSLLPSSLKFLFHDRVD